MGYLTRNQYTPLTNVAFGMKPGEISKPFKTPYGWDIIRVTEFVKKQEIPPAEKIQRARARMEALQTAQVYQEIMKNLKEKNTVVLYADNIKQLAAATAGKTQ
uniref:Peptidylprolyl isomerase n=1 Tax=Candidatus Desulfatibia profunda TaxID=2841695 RepID=A0A8J6NYH5_9BACT|nr:peptidylprolyl isomerase [Candidatus Desulfatibia profunda]